MYITLENTSDSFNPEDMDTCVQIFGYQILGGTGPDSEDTRVIGHTEVVYYSGTDSEEIIFEAQNDGDTERAAKDFYGLQGPLFEDPEDLLLLKTMFLEPSVRGQGIGLEVAQGLIKRHAGRHTHVGALPSPTEKRSSVGTKAAQESLRGYWRNLGFNGSANDHLWLYPSSWNSITSEDEEILAMDPDVETIIDPETGETWYTDRDD